MKSYSKELKIDVAAEVVFQALTEPKHLKSWYDCTAQLALREGGHFTIADSEGDVYESGEYLEVKKNSLLKYKMEHHGFYKGSEV